MNGRRRVIAVVAVAILVCGFVRASTTSTANPHAVRIEIKALQFGPARAEAHVGDTIVWHNADVFSHTATSKGVFDTGEIKPGATVRHVMRKAGTFAYLCSFHSTMKGSLVVR